MPTRSGSMGSPRTWIGIVVLDSGRTHCRRSTCAPTAPAHFECCHLRITHGRQDRAQRVIGRSLAVATGAPVQHQRHTRQCLRNDPDAAQHRHIAHGIVDRDHRPGRRRRQAAQRARRRIVFRGAALHSIRLRTMSPITAAPACAYRRLSPPPARRNRHRSTWRSCSATDINQRRSAPEPPTVSDSNIASCRMGHYRKVAKQIHSVATHLFMSRCTSVPFYWRSPLRAPQSPSGAASRSLARRHHQLAPSNRPGPVLWRFPVDIATARQPDRRPLPGVNRSMIATSCFPGNVSRCPGQPRAVPACRCRPPSQARPPERSSATSTDCAHNERCVAAY